MGFPAAPAIPLVVLNPHAARLHDPATRRALTDALVRAVEARTGLTPRVVDGSVAGGDGSVRQAAAALAGSGIPLAIVPTGTGNVLARGLGIGGPAAAVRALPMAREHRLDLGQVRWGQAGDPAHTAEEIFVVACAMGLDARIAGTDDNTAEVRRRRSA